MTQPETSDKKRTFNILFTDYASHLIAESCQDFGDSHQMDHVVLTRLKEPSIYGRLQMREKLLSVGVQPEELEKGALVECWGEDLFHVQ
jgi:hypothetical protein